MKNIGRIAVAAGIWMGMTAAAQASWCHEEAVSSTGATIRMDHEIASSFSRFDGQIIYRSNVWLNLIDSSLTGEESVRFVLLNYNRSGNLTQTLEYDGEYFEDTQMFSAKGPLGVQISGQYSGEKYNEVAVVVDGVWLKNNNGDSNFYFNANQYEGNCANPY